MFEEYLSIFKKYKIHNHGYIARDHFEYLESVVKNGYITLETGGGLTSLLFASRSSYHYAIFPDDIKCKIFKAANDLGINLCNVDFIKGKSDQILPNLKMRPLDFVLIDGGHEFPIPIIDWYYTYRSLRVGGIVMLDDSQIKSVRILSNFLNLDDHWEVDGRGERFVSYKKLEEYDSFFGGWLKQGYNRGNLM